jgi:hypothetical protein
MPYYEGESTSPLGLQVVEQLTTIMSKELEKTGWKYPIPDVSDMEFRKFLHQLELDFWREFSHLKEKNGSRLLHTTLPCLKLLVSLSIW